MCQHHQHGPAAPRGEAAYLVLPSPDIAQAAAESTAALLPQTIPTAAAIPTAGNPA